MHRVLVPCLLGAVCAAAPAAEGPTAADGLSAPWRRIAPGLWEVRSRLEMTLVRHVVGPRSEAGRLTTEQCIGPRQDAGGWQRGARSRFTEGMQCGEPQGRSRRGGYSVEMDCHGAGGRTLLSTSLSGDPSKAFHVFMRASFFPPRQGIAAGELTLDWKHLGACPAELQPGQSRTVHR